MSWFVPLYLLGLLAIIIPVARRSIRADREMNAVLTSGEPAFPWRLNMAEMRAAPELWRERLRGKVRSIHAVSIPIFDVPQGGMGARDDSRPNYSSFLVDSHGEPHDLESNQRWEPIETNAAWLAQLLEVPFESRI